jgi:hypothetical protein
MYDSLGWVLEGNMGRVGRWDGMGREGIGMGDEYIRAGF